MRFPLRAITGIVGAATFPLLTRADMSTLQVQGPSSASVISTPGLAVSTAAVTRMKSAAVNIVLRRGDGDKLVASCVAVFAMESKTAEPKMVWTDLVAFPVTGLRGGALEIKTFSVTVDGVRPPTVFRKYISFPSGMADTAIYGKLDQKFTSRHGDHGMVILNQLVDGTTYFDAYLWSQEFASGSESTVEVKYEVALTPQPVSYRKTFMHGGNPDLVPFDALRLPDEVGRAYFFDYVLLSGATWLGPIGHESITLRFDPSIAPITLNDEDEVIAFGRHISRYGQDDLKESIERMRAGLGPEHFKRQADTFVWEIVNEKPREDILVQIPYRRVWGVDWKNK